MSNAIKEAIIMLLVCLAGMLLFAVVFYEFIPNRKVVPEVAKYEVTEQVQEMLADNVDQENNNVVKTYTVTASDLNNYEVKKDYVPGKANPFAAITEDPEVGSSEKKSNSKSGTNSTSESNTTSENTTKSTSNETNGSSNSLIDDEGAK